MIEVINLAARESPLALASLTFPLERGAHAFVGGPEDGGPLLLAVLAGRVRPRAGSVRVLGRAPAEARAAIAYVPLEAHLPDALRVDETLRTAAIIRGEPPRDPRARLSVLGLTELAPRPVRSLSREEARAVALVEALTSTRANVLLVEEPFVGVDPRALPHVAGAIAARAREGACVVIATASPRDAAELADDQFTLLRGTLVRHGDSADPIAVIGADGVRMRVLTSEPRPLLAELTKEKTIAGIETQGRALLVRGRDAKELAQAVGRAVIRANVDLIELRPESPAVEELRAAATGAAAAAYHNAYDRARTPATQPPADVAQAAPVPQAPQAPAETPS